MRRPLLLAAVAVALVGAACSSSDTTAERASTSTSTSSSSSSSSSTTTTTTTGAGTAGCGRPAPATDRRHLVHATLDSSGGTRAYIVYVPESYDPDVPAPVAYVFHGASSNKEQQLAYSHYQPYADKDGALLVLPDALGQPTRWSPFGPNYSGVKGVDDLAFFDDLTAAVDARLCVDTARVLVTGMSSGGFMAAAVACTHSDSVSAVGPVTATVWAKAVCGQAKPVAYAYFHGTADPVVPFKGGPNSPGPVEQTSQSWADQNGCSGPPKDERVGTEVIHRHWSGCKASTDLYIVVGGGHTWPGAIPVDRLGHTTHDIDATKIIWDTFRATWPSR